MNKMRTNNKLIDEFDFQAFINFAFVLCSNNLDTANLFGMSHMCAAVGLEVQPNYLHNANLLHFGRQQINLGANPVRDRESLLTRQRIDAYRVIGLDRLVDFSLDKGLALFAEILYREIHASAVRIHLAAGHLDAELAPDSAAENMQRRVSAHHAVAEVPINGTDHLCADCWWQAVQCMPDHIVAFIERDHIAALLVIVPAHQAVIGQLATAARIKHRSIQPDFVTFNGHNRRGRLKHKAIFVIKQLGFHRMLLCFSASGQPLVCNLLYSRSKKNPLSAKGREEFPWYHPD